MPFRTVWKQVFNADGLLAGRNPDKVPRVDFKPFAITTSFGSVRPTGDRSINVELAPEEQAELSLLRNEQRALVSGIERSITAGPDEELIGRYYGLLSGLREPIYSTERARLESRAAAQGRLGLNLGIGGTPEMQSLDQEIGRQRMADRLEALKFAEASQQARTRMRLDAIAALSNRMAEIYKVPQSLLEATLRFAMGDAEAQARYSQTLADFIQRNYATQSATHQWMANHLRNIVNDVAGMIGSAKLGSTLSSLLKGGAGSASGASAAK